MVQALLIIGLVFIAGMIAIRIIGSREQNHRRAVASAHRGPWESDTWDHLEHPFHCVTCTCDNPECHAVDPLQDERYLVRTASELPVPECTTIGCRCHYIHHPDRREAEQDRRATFGLEQEMYHLNHGKDRRVTLGRRLDDWTIA